MKITYEIKSLYLNYLNDEIDKLVQEVRKTDITKMIQNLEEKEGFEKECEVFLDNGKKLVDLNRKRDIYLKMIDCYWEDTVSNWDNLDVDLVIQITENCSLIIIEDKENDDFFN